MIKVILWDIDGTLLDFHAAQHEAILSLFKKHNLGICTEEMISVYSDINKKYWEALERGEMTKPEILVGRFIEFFSTYGIDVSKAPAFNDDYQLALGDTIVFFPGAYETVKSLKGSVVQCLVTNGTKTAQEKKLKNSGLGKLFDYIFISEDMGVEKPNKTFFDMVFDSIGHYASDEVIIIGDSLTSDIKGGNNAGILTCHFNPESLPVKSDVKIDYTIHSLYEVNEILASRSPIP